MSLAHASWNILRYLSSLTKDTKWRWMGRWLECLSVVMQLLLLDVRHWRKYGYECTFSFVTSQYRTQVWNPANIIITFAAWNPRFMPVGIKQVQKGEGENKQICADIICVWHLLTFCKWGCMFWWHRPANILFHTCLLCIILANPCSGLWRPVPRKRPRGVCGRQL